VNIIYDNYVNNPLADFPRFSEIFFYKSISFQLPYVKKTFIKKFITIGRKRIVIAANTAATNVIGVILFAADHTDLPTLKGHSTDISVQGQDANNLVLVANT